MRLSNIEIGTPYRFKDETYCWFIPLEKLPKFKCKDGSVANCVEGQWKQSLWMSSGITKVFRASDIRRDDQ